MSQQTWIDVGAGWLSSFLPDAKGPFTPEQTACLKLLLEEFGKSIGQVIAEKLNDQQQSIHASLQMRCREEVTHSQAASNCDESRARRNSDRKARRRKAKQKFSVQRDMLLKLRPVTDLNLKPNVIEARQRVSLSIDVLVPNAAEHVERKGFDHGLSADVLSLQCRSARFLQNWWRHTVRGRGGCNGFAGVCRNDGDAADVTDENPTSSPRNDHFWDNTMTETITRQHQPDLLSLAALKIQFCWRKHCRRRESHIWQCEVDMFRKQMELHYLPGCQREWCIFDATKAHARESRSLEAQALVRQQINQATATTLDIDAHKYSAESLHIWSNAFSTIATFMPHVGLNAMGYRLRSSFLLAQGRTLSDADVQAANEIDSDLDSLILSDLRDDAARYFIAVGHFQCSSR